MKKRTKKLLSVGAASALGVWPGAKVFCFFFSKKKCFLFGFCCEALTACAGPVEKACPLAGAAPMQIVELYFGRDVPGRASVTAAEWADFSGHELTPRFPDGFTVLDGQGQWRNPRTGVIGREASWVVVAAVPMGTDLAARVDPVVGAYRARFHQESVGVVTEEACGRF